LAGFKTERGFKAGGLIDYNFLDKALLIYFYSLNGGILGGEAPNLNMG